MSKRVRSASLLPQLVFVFERVLLFVCLAVVVCGCNDDDDDSPRRNIGVLGALPNGQGIIVGGTVDGGYSYEAYIPVDYDEAEETPVVIAMHGTGGSAGGMIAMWEGLADSENFIVLAPYYVNNATYFTVEGEDAIFDMLVELADFYTLDDRRRYVNGVSTGGTWSFIFAIENSLSVAAASVFSGGYTGENALFVSLAARDISFYLNHGAADGVLSVVVARDARDALEGLGHDVDYVEHAGGHSVPASAPNEAWDFMEVEELATDPLR